MAGLQLGSQVGSPPQHRKKVWSTNLLEGRGLFSAENMAAIPSLEALPAQPSLHEAAIIARGSAHKTSRPRLQA